MHYQMHTFTVPAPQSCKGQLRDQGRVLGEFCKWPHRLMWQISKIQPLNKQTQFSLWILWFSIHFTGFPWVVSAVSGFRSLKEAGEEPCWAGVGSLWKGKPFSCFYCLLGTCIPKSAMLRWNQRASSRRHERPWDLTVSISSTNTI